MFEDSTFESNGKIRTRSRGWMFAAFALNGSVVLALILIPLIYPEALPGAATTILMEAPRPPAPETRTRPMPEREAAAQTETRNESFSPPRRINRDIFVDHRQAPVSGNIADLAPLGSGSDSGGNGSPDDPFNGIARPPVVARPAVPKLVRVSGMVVEGMLIRKTVPAYPPIAKATGTHGTVVIEATISKSGTIENPRAVSGPAMLRQAALDAVATWRYRPYMLNDEPVEVETTVNVVFELGR